jgi:2-keto-4-pentenoate hydratase/2-oxohepta-3-ene-1,7-dioic acid hydratase in catechol pathway
MRLIRYSIRSGQAYGILEGGDVFRATGSIAGGFEKGSRVGEIDDVELLHPVVPSKIIAAGRNYAAHAAEFRREIPEEPIMFLKPPSSLIAHGDAIRLPPESSKVQYEGELAVVIGQKGRDVSDEEAEALVFGYTCANDVSARDLQLADVQWTRGKGFDTFCPLGPWIDTEFDPKDKDIECRVNGAVRQESNTRNMLFGIPTLISYISGIMTLEPGDIVLTGTPEGVGDLSPGDLVEVEVEELGILRNPVE